MSGHGAATKVILALFGLLALLGLGLFVVNVSESSKTYVVVIKWDGGMPAREVAYWRYSTFSDLMLKLGARTQADGSIVYENTGISIRTLMPTTFHRTHKIGDRWVVLQVTCSDVTTEIWETVIEIDESVLRSGVVSVANPCNDTTNRTNIKWKRLSETASLKSPG